MYSCIPQHHFLQFHSATSPNPKVFNSRGSSLRNLIIRAVSTTENQVSSYIPAAPIFLPEGPWKQVPGGVTAAEGFKAAGIYGGLRAKGEKPDLALVTCDVDAISAGSFTTNVVAAAPVLYCKRTLDISKTARAVLTNAGQANAATGEAGYQDVLECVESLAKLLKMKPEEVLVESTGVIGQRIRKGALLNSLPILVNSLSSSVDRADSAAVAITTTDLVSKSVAIESLVDGDTSTNDTVIALASGLCGLGCISSLDSDEAIQLQGCLDAVMQGLAKSIAWDGEGATCLIEVGVTGANSESEAAKVARSVASSSLVKAAVYGRDPNWGRIAAAAGYSGVSFHQNLLRVELGDILLMDAGEPQLFDRGAASSYLRKAGETHDTVRIQISVGNGPGRGQAWGCDLSYDYVKINAEYTT
ncbi:arginine biosynthesis bifunctional protein ArgJ, chloroplastic isoform X3 [Gastrolobium bilobum]|uniref:arginine biosynthesis bifunctional protein ArgJ, chloroplastic isoform X3 n=1 Tax=Gastrolobium bilobum TaxID=150636 RepID=UPI002AB152AB|nr:arginine biosynthesis bifunctional protein ArgJ, chloroplastic isoform X3 [Gastrolobium bilobum]